MKARRIRTAGLLIAVTGLLLTGVPLTTAHAASDCPVNDDGGSGVNFDGDFHGDAAFGEPSRRVGGVAAAGAVRVQQSCAPDFVLTAATLGYPLQAFARFGTTVISTHIDNDGYDDLVIGAPGQNRLGVVVVVYGSPHGLGRGKPALRLRPPVQHAGDRFGQSVAVALTQPVEYTYQHHVIVGAPGVDVGGAKDAGTVYDFAVAPSGTSTTVPRAWVQGRGGIPGTAEKNDRFGEVLSVGDRWVNLPDQRVRFDYVVAVGVPAENVGRVTDAGSVYLVTGAALDQARAFSRATRGVPGTPHAGDHFGAAVSAGHGTAYVGVPGDDVGHARDAGSVQRVLIGPDSSLTVTARRTQDSAGVAGTSESGDHLGSSLVALQDSYGNGRQVAAGVPGEDLGRRRDAGAVSVLSFHAGCGGCALLTQDTAGIPGTAEAGDQFGASLTASGVTRYATGFQDANDFLIGVPGEDRGTRKNAGMIVRASYPYRMWDVAAAAGERLGEVPAAVETN